MASSNASSKYLDQSEGPVNRSIEMLRIEMRLEDGESWWESEREERKEETSRKSETARLAIINHIRSWRPPRILATRQTLRLPSVPFPSCSSSPVTAISHTAPGRAREKWLQSGNVPNSDGTDPTPVTEA